MAVDVSGAETGVVQHAHQRLKLDTSYTPFSLNLALQNGRLVWAGSAFRSPVGRIVDLLANLVVEQHQIVQTERQQLKYKNTLKNVKWIKKKSRGVP